jgi:hypothetical protein
VKPEAGQVHVLGSHRRVEPVENPANAIGMPCVDALALAPGEEALNA